ncbi:DUF4907 domain-containing protein [Emticicia sp. C21]|uniref:DUF4907 domain-containing protein n=1 Tax=Emticicia sp. C21 TaxID=2302915 RepID=UPI001314155C|nr:DUF4907 domain-containing protein [Emticicia sp. C21]
MKVIFIFLFCISISFIGLAQKPKQTPGKSQDYGILYTHNDSLQYETYPLPNGWGYKLYLRYKLLVNQPIIPALAGNQGFKTEKDAKKIAQLAIGKVAKGQMPPTLEAKEVKKALKL